jgi:hypothetical protein
MMAAVINPDDYALVIGIDHYPTYRCLRGAVHDADDFHRWLLEESGGGLDPANCRIILSPEASECNQNPYETCVWSAEKPCRWLPDQQPRRPIQDEIDDACEALLALVKGRTRQTGRRGRRLYIFCSGHGLSRDANGSDVCLAKWSSLSRYEAIDAMAYLKMFTEFGLFREIVVFLDCCRDRKVNTGGRGSRLSPPMPDEGAGQVQTFVAFATEFQNSAYEALRADAAGGDGPVIRGHFSHVLMNALRGAAARPQGGVTGSRLAAYLEQNVPSLAANGQRAQFPRFLDGFRQAAAEDLILGNAQPSVNVRLHFGPDREGWYELIGPDTQVIRGGDASESPWNIRLESGRLYVMRGRQGRLERLEVPAGEGMHDVTF